ncbi:MAG: MarR family transcriptional regulator [Candidatus Izemoplasmatales bacterium]|nr:MarR family transcriptional regulator [Candidatus Izemoplasmatales bacterium]
MEKRYDHMISKYQHRFLEERLKNLEINRSEAPYLKTIYTHDSMKMNDLIAKFFFHKSHSTRAIKSLVAQGYIVKTVDEEDKRAFVLSITDKGRIVAGKIVKILAEWNELMESFLEKEELEFMNAIQKKVYDKLRNYYQEEEIDG